MSQPVKGSAEWFEQKKQARADLDMRLSLGLPHSSKPLNNSVVDLTKLADTAEAAAAKKAAAKAKRDAAKAKKAAAKADTK